MTAGLISRRRTVVLLGNPNTGKSSLFNRLTGGRQRVGNYPGVTVSLHHGVLRLEGHSVRVTDLPGAYSLAASSPDERLAADVLTGRHGPPPELVVCVADASRLRRSLFVVRQALDFGLPVILAVNFIDEWEGRGHRLDAAALAERLGFPVVAVSARTGRGLETLREAVDRMLAGTCPPAPRPQWPEAVDRSVALLRTELARISNRSFADHELRRALFDEDSSYLDLAGVAPAGRGEIMERVLRPLREAGLDPGTIESERFYRAIDEALAGNLPAQAGHGVSGIDRWLTHRLAGPVVFALVMALLFQCIYGLSEPVVSGIEAIFGALNGLASGWLESTPMFRSLVCDGVLAGVGGVLVFVPQIAMLFFFLAVLEGSGYLARGAFLADRLFGWCGLTGKSFVPLLSGSACAVPGILAARTIEEPGARLVTILVTPLMGCSARLPVYLLLIGAFIQPLGGAAVAGMVLLGLQAFGFAAALAAAFVINRLVLRTPPQPFVLELPPYRMPLLRDIVWRIGAGTGDFLQRAGTLILAFSIFIWALLYFPHRSDLGPSAQVEQSFLGRAGKALEPVFAPAGFDWRVTVAVLASFPARELAVSTLGIIFNAEDDSDSLGGALRDARWASGPRAGQPVFTLPVVAAVMVFFALCLQCSSTVAVMAREAGWRIAATVFVGYTTLAWLAAVIVFQVGSGL